VVASRRGLDDSGGFDLTFRNLGTVEVSPECMDCCGIFFDAPRVGQKVGAIVDFAALLCLFKCPLCGLVCGGRIVEELGAEVRAVCMADS
jgi:hypothetical protein